MLILYALFLGFISSLKYIICGFEKALYVLATEETDIEKKKKEEDYDDYPKEKIPYPTQIFYIISMETCERFSYYGMNGKEIQMLILLRF